MAMNGRANCVLQICCRQGDATDALAEQIMEDLGEDAASAKKYAKWINDTFDLARKGTLKAFKDDIAKLARENPEK